MRMTALPSYHQLVKVKGYERYATDSVYEIRLSASIHFAPSYGLA